MRAVAVGIATLSLLAGAVARAESGSGATGRATDLEAAATSYVAQSLAFTPATRAAALKFIAGAKPRAAGMTPEQFLLSVFRIAAFADNGHDTVNDHDDVWWPAGRLPLRMIWFEDGWVVSRARSDYADLLGGRVIAVEGRSPAQVFARLKQYWGGPDASRRWNLEFLLENEGLLHAAGLAAGPKQLRMTVINRWRTVVERDVPFVPRAALPPGQLAHRVWTPESWPQERELGWNAFTPEPTPLYLQDGGRNFRAVPLPELETLYVQFRLHFDLGGERLEDFRDVVDRLVATAAPRNLIVDLRFDTGGNTDLTRDWQRELVSRVPGEIYVLIGRYTFSAGIVSAAAFKHDAAGRAHLVGESVGDRLRWWSEGRDACLPVSKYCLHVTTGLWDLVHGCAADAACYGDKYGAQVTNLDPEITAPLTLADYLGGRDPALAAVRSDLAHRESHRSATRQ